NGRSPEFGTDTDRPAMIQLNARTMGLSLLQFLKNRARNLHYPGRMLFVKRLMDVAVALPLLVALLPLFGLVALLVKLTDFGPVLFWQKRVGRGGREFWMPKFRSMVPNAEKLKDLLALCNDHGDGITFKMKRDPRITWVGRVIRKLSIDELPQLWC